ncbi:MAG TPA: S1 RNA-binding domain-containing protein [Chthonomonadaceae bacterium]|nr:S1 RNA-binding domain-containing protein [Chthonomonadaceae bacterium]
MSDEMVQEKTEAAAGAAPEGADENGAPHGSAPAVSASSQVAATGAADEPAPAQPGASSAASASSVPSASTAGSDAGEFERALQDYDKQFDQALNQLLQDTVVTGTVMRIDREGVLVDVGAKSEGIIRMNELSREAGPGVNPESIVKVGEQIRVYVLESENQDGIPVLSKKRADFEQAWVKVQRARETGETLHARVSERVKGGLVVDLGIRGFVPASHVGTGSLKNNLDKYVGTEIALKVIEVDKDKRKVVLSNKMAAAEEREARSAETKASLAPDQIRHGIVRRLTPYGAFIDLGGIDGLLHISEMSWTRINDPKELLREGQELDVKILKMDLENNRVSLGLKQILPDPWVEIPNRYKEGDTITGSVTRHVPFGAFVQVEGGVEGIIPNQEMARSRTGKGTAVPAVGEEVTVKVIELRPDARKMTLSLRALQPAEPGAPPAGRAPGADEPAREPGAAPARPKRARSDRSGERDEQEDYNRFAGGRQDEPRFTIGDAFAAAKKDRSRRERRTTSEEEFDENFDIDADIDAEIDGAETEGEDAAHAEGEAAGAEHSA